MDTILPISMLLIGLCRGWRGLLASVQTQSSSTSQTMPGARQNAEIAGLKADLFSREAEIDQHLSEVSDVRIELKVIQEDFTTLKAREAHLETTIDQERRQAVEKLELLNKAQEKLSDAFKALSSDALQNNNESFLKLANATLEKFHETATGDLDKRQQAIDGLIKPVEKSLKQVDEKLQDIEKKRLEAYTGLNEQVKMLTETQKELRAETSNLVNALRRPDVRGRWGEIQLQRVVEMAGMLEHCDFFQQQSRRD